MRESIAASTRLVAIVLAYSLTVQACNHASDIGSLLDGVCKVAVHMLQSQNASADAGVSNGH